MDEMVVRLPLNRSGISSLHTLNTPSQLDSFSETKMEMGTMKSPDGKTTVTVTVHWGKRNEEWYFMNCGIKRLRDITPEPADG